MAEVEILFNYRPDGREVTLNDNVRKVTVLVFREGPRGIVAMVREFGPIVLWDKTEVDSHRNDTEDQLIDKLKEIIG